MRINRSFATFLGKPAAKYRGQEDVEFEESDECESSRSSPSDFEGRDNEPIEKQIVPFESRDCVQHASPTSTDKPASESSTVYGANLKVVFGVEYRAPD